MIIEGLAEELEKEVSYCEGRSLLYHDLFTILGAVEADLRVGQGASDATSAFGSALSMAWAGRQFVSAFERPLLLAASLHRLVLSGGAPELAIHYASAGGEYGGNASRLRAAIEETVQRPEFAATLASQTLQTNEISRSVAWLLPFAVMAAGVRRPCFLIELGCSAGLNLVADELAWRWTSPNGEVCTGDGAVVEQAIDNTSSADVMTALRALPQNRVAIVERHGCDLSVPDLWNPSDVLQLRSAIWGDDVTRLRRLDRALAAAMRLRRAGRAPALSSSDLFTFLPAISHEIARDPAEPLLVLIFNTVVTAYLDDAAHARLVALVRDLFVTVLARHCCVWAELEPPRESDAAVDPASGDLAVLRMTVSASGILRSGIVARTELHPSRVRLLPAFDDVVQADDV